MYDRGTDMNADHDEQCPFQELMQPIDLMTCPESAP
jgi:hypothetical protein